MSRELGRHIRAAREAKGWDQVALGRQFGVTKSAVNQWESGKNVPDQKKQYRLAQLLDLDPDMVRALATGEPWPRAPEQASFLAPASTSPAEASGARGAAGRGTARTAAKAGASGNTLRDGGSDALPARADAEAAAFPALSRPAGAARAAGPIGAAHGLPFEPVGRVPQAAGALAVADIPVWASAAAGDGEGAMILTAEPIDYIRRSERMVNVRDPWAFHVVGDSMLERLAPGDQVVINPAMPLLPMTDCVFVHQAEDGNLYALVKRLLRANADAWRVRQLNPARDFDLSRRKWTKAYRIAEIRPRM